MLSLSGGLMWKSSLLSIDALEAWNFELNLFRVKESSE